MTRVTIKCTKKKRYALTLATGGKCNGVNWMLMVIRKECKEIIILEVAFNPFGLQTYAMSPQ